MARHEPTLPGSPVLPEPGPELDASIARIEQGIREQLASGVQPGGAVRMELNDALLLIGCVRELLRDRDALLEEIDALETGAGRPRAS
ncbi:MAG TPA: hypothetical protein VFA79_21025 [Myxococcales bacterium]|nr:hypothetical protein [Myxococcales bacterium]